MLAESAAVALAASARVEGEECLKMPQKAPRGVSFVVGGLLGYVRLLLPIALLFGFLGLDFVVDGLLDVIGRCGSPPFLNGFAIGDGSDWG